MYFHSQDTQILSFSPANSLPTLDNTYKKNTYLFINLSSNKPQSIPTIDLGLSPSNSSQSSTTQSKYYNIHSINCPLINHKACIKM